MVCGYGCGSSSSNVESQIDSLEFHVNQCESAMLKVNTSKFMIAAEGIQNALTYLNNREVVKNYFTDNGNLSRDQAEENPRLTAYANKLSQSRSRFHRLMTREFPNSMMDEIVSDPDYLARYRKLDYFTENYYLR